MSFTSTLQKNDNFHRIRRTKLRVVFFDGFEIAVNAEPWETKNTSMCQLWHVGRLRDMLVFNKKFVWSRILRIFIFRFLTNQPRMISLLPRSPETNFLTELRYFSSISFPKYHQNFQSFGANINIKRVYFFPFLKFSIYNNRSNLDQRKKSYSYVTFKSSSSQKIIFSNLE